MKIFFDEREFNVDDQKKNIVDIAEENGVFIQAPCYRNHHKKGCCMACLIEVDGKELYACQTKPVEGMKIVYDSDKLKEKREVRLREYAEAIQKGEHKPCNCGCDDGTNSGCGCGGGCT